MLYNIFLSSNVPLNISSDWPYYYEIPFSGSLKTVLKFEIFLFKFNRFTNKQAQYNYRVCKTKTIVLTLVLDWAELFFFHLKQSSIVGWIVEMRSVGEWFNKHYTTKPYLSDGGIGGTFRRNIFVMLRVNNYFGFKNNQ